MKYTVVKIINSKIEYQSCTLDDVQEATEDAFGCYKSWRSEYILKESDDTTVDENKENQVYGCLARHGCYIEDNFTVVIVEH